MSVARHTCLYARGQHGPALASGFRSHLLNCVRDGFRRLPWHLVRGFGDDHVLHVERRGERRHASRRNEDVSTACEHGHRDLEPAKTPAEIVRSDGPVVGRNRLYAGATSDSLEATSGGFRRLRGVLPRSDDPEVDEVDEAVEIAVLQGSRGPPVRLGVDLGTDHDDARDGLGSAKGGLQRHRPAERVPDEHGCLPPRYMVGRVFGKVLNPLQRRSKATAVSGEFVDDHRPCDERHDFGPDLAILASPMKENDWKPLRRLLGSHQTSGDRAGAREGQLGEAHRASSRAGTAHFEPASELGLE